MNTDFSIANERIVLRPVEAGDADFLYLAYASTRADEMALVPWTDTQKDAFLQMQFQAQTTHYRSHNPKAAYQIIQGRGGLPMGRLIIDRSGGSILLMDIILLPRFRNLGIGTTLMQDLLAEAAFTNKPVLLHVEAYNPAMKLYERLGFVKRSEQGVYHQMIWNPESDRS